MAASISDKFLKVGKRGTKTTLASPGKAPIDTAVTLTNPANWETATAIMCSFYQEDPTTHKEMEGTYTVWKGIVVGSQVTSLQQVYGPTDMTYPAGTIAVMHISAAWANAFIDAILVTLKQDGTLKSGLTIDTPTLVSPTVTTPPANIGRMPGEMVTWPIRFAPAGWLTCDGSAVSRTTYAALFSALNPSLGAVTMTIASPGLVTLASHSLLTGDGVFLTTTGSLPTGLAQNTQYWVIKNDANSFWLATSPANAAAGTKINTTGSQSGAHTLTFCPWGVGNGSTTFNIPDVRGRVLVGLNPSDSDFNTVGKSGGEKTHTMTINELVPHTHAYHYFGAQQKPQGTGAATAASIDYVNENTGSQGGGQAFNVMNPYRAANLIIKF